MDHHPRADVDKPILLNLGMGGPGGVDSQPLPFEPLEKDFVW